MNNNYLPENDRQFVTNSLEAALNQIAPHLTIIGSWLLLTAKGTG